MEEAADCLLGFKAGRSLAWDTCPLHTHTLTQDYAPQARVQTIYLFVTVPGSSINSWDSWFIFNLRKNKHLLLHDTLYMGKDKRIFAVTSEFVHTLAV
jgi:hypothetical protein